MTRINDEGDRLRALTELKSTLLVESAAGTGKTSLLAGRVVMLLATGTNVRSIAAITFTELAAGELRGRIAQYLDALLAGKIPEELKLAFPQGPTPDQVECLRAAASRLDELTACTIHSFCLDLLRTHSVEARIDPGAEILDRDQAEFAFDAIFDQWWRDRLDKPSSANDALALVACKDPIGAERLLREFAKFRRSHRNARPLPPEIEANDELEFVEAVREFRRWCDRVHAPGWAAEEVAALETLASHFEGRFDSLPKFEQLWDLAHPTPLPIMRKDTFDLREYRRRSAWMRVGGKADGDRLADEAELHYAVCRDAYGTLMGRIATSLVSVFSTELDGLLANYEAFKRRAAVVDFDDLLFTCRDVLRAYPEVRKASSDRFSRILVDEFQDTDPVQAEIIFLLATAPDDALGWLERRLRPGNLFLVGDPKQAIYRFRGADLATYLMVRRAVEAEFPDSILRVTTNFRSRTDILEHVNLCFKDPLAAQESGYVPLHGTRGAGGHGLPCVAKTTIHLLPNTGVDSGRDDEARAVAEICRNLIGSLEICLKNGESRPLAPGDIALLAPVSTNLWRYERALEEAGLPFASQAGKNLFRRQETQDFVALVRTLADSRDTLALGALLRGPLVGLSEQELLTIAADLPTAGHDGEFPRLSLQSVPELIQHDVAREVLTILRDLKRRVRSTAPALLLAEAVERLRVRAIVRARSADQATRSLANIDSLLERARSYGVRGFSQFARDLDREWSNGSGQSEGMVEADGQSIEIVTVHSSKGLEWPVVIPINCVSQPRRPEKFVYRRNDETLHWALGSVTPPSLKGALQGEIQEKRNEDLRLLYVACTRAMELLVVPAFTWSDDASWAKLLDFRLDQVPELDLAYLPQRSFIPPAPVENQQSADLFAAEQLRLEKAHQLIRWIHPSDSDPDVVPIQLSTPQDEGGPLQPSLTIEGGRTRGVILHKLMEELLTGELDGSFSAVKSRADVLRKQLDASTPDPEEMASTALRTLSLAELQPFQGALTAEVTIYGVAPISVQVLIVGRADAVARVGDGSLVVFDWKSDIAPKESDRSAYRQQLAQYMHVIGAQRGAIVYMTSGYVDWIAAPRLA
ncbi:AAA family ATPase [Bradyrhizobium pachyrhizi]|uniref:DNA 3'-5' helicase n=1 Tax=Bradyrhizobium pachyrhizi TaxID=280333 RepID=A0A844SLA5_9BRAD|nr:UvrD-helicase domain-containing protein [Bradyrhizobium pachyrhizi]MVT64839.1 AAA family ATPase [Bradyrhizobium pachyrhizi]